MLGVRADDMEDIKYLFTSGGYGTDRGKGLPGTPASKSSPALPASALVSKRFVAYLTSFLGVSFYLKTTDPLVSRAIDVLYGKELQWCLYAVDDKVFEDYVLHNMKAWYERYPPKKGKKSDGDEESREDEEDAGALDGEDWGGVTVPSLFYGPYVDSKDGKQIIHGPCLFCMRMLPSFNQTGSKQLEAGGHSLR